MRSTLACTALFALAGCASLSPGPRPTGSTVQYVLLVPPDGSDYDDHGLGEHDNHDDSEAIDAASSVVRYEPIRRGYVPSTYPSTTIDTPARPRPRAPVATQTDAARATDGIVVPYPTDKFFRGFGPCRRDGRHHHEAIDLGGVGPDWGIGTPILSMTRARVELIGTGDDDPHEFGVPDRRGGTTVRGRTELPRSKVIEGYGRVHFFTKKKGRWRSGTVVVTRAIGGPLDGHRIRYMHLGAVHPSLSVGSIVAPGQELGLMGGTGVQESAPHVHIDIQDPEGRRVDVAPLIGLEPTARGCGEEVAQAPGAGSTVTVIPDRSRFPRPTGGADPEPSGGDARVWVKRADVPSCGVWLRAEDFASGRYDAHDVQLQIARGDKVVVDVAREAGAWNPKIEVRDAEGALITGKARARRKPPVTTRIVRTGRKGGRATVVVEARADADVTVRLTAWPPRRAPAGSELLPRDGRYSLSIEQRCGR